MTGTIQQITGNGTWKSEHGLMYSFHYLIDGITYQMNHKTATPPFNEGELLNFQITRDGGEYPDTIAKIRDEQPPMQQQPIQQQAATPPINKDKSIVLQVCIKAAAEYTAQSVIHWEDEAEKMLQWYISKMTTKKAPPPPPVQEETDGLPF